MTLDPTKLSDWQIAEVAEDSLTPITEVAAKLGIQSDEIAPYGKFYGKLDARSIISRLDKPNAPRAKFIDVTAINPTPLGEGKTTTTIGLLQGLGKLGKSPVGAIRQPSGGPTFNVKGSAAGGGLAQCLPLAPLSLGLTGDIDAINNANNLCMTALTARIQHESNYDDARLAKSGLRRLSIDPARLNFRWSIDFCAQALRSIVIGRGGKSDGFEMDSGFYITVASEVMAILAVSRDLADMRERMSRIVVAWSTDGKPVTAGDLEVAGAMTAWMVRAINPTLMQTLEGQPVLVHAGPFANIAIGQSSVIADNVGSLLGDYLVTESGFGADMGFEKFWNIKCRVSGMTPSAVVIVATIRALKSHGGGPEVKPGAKLDEAYTKENIALVERGCSNLLAHIETVKLSGVTPVVCLNSFHTDTPAEHAAVRRIAEAAGALFAVSAHWLKGGEGARELAEAVIDAAAKPADFKFLYTPDEPVETRINKIATKVYGADGVEYSELAAAKLQSINASPEFSKLPVCVAKTQYSLSHDPTLRGRPKGWKLPVKDILTFSGAGFVVPVCGDIKLMPGTASDPAFRRIDVDPATGKVKGLF
ncbi:MAG: formate--tetrahydrofolate ligase [Kiritimatiellaeota bacterium]|nr:formate--tetrahydrofolate ligase [Kiritimatiellota bacterium]